MKHIFQIIFLLVICSYSTAQSLTRDPLKVREEANKDWNGKYTLYDFWNDNPILPDAQGIYKFYYDLKPQYIVTDTKIHEIHAIDKPESFRGTIAEMNNLGLSGFCKFESYWTWEKWKNNAKPITTIPQEAQKFVPNVLNKFNTASSQFVFCIWMADSKNKFMGYKEMTIMNDGSNNVNIKTYGAESTLTNDFNGKWKIFQMMNYSSLKITFDQNSINNGTDLCLSYQLLMNYSEPVGLKDMNGGFWDLKNKSKVQFTPKSPIENTDWWSYKSEEQKKIEKEELEKKKLEDEKKRLWDEKRKKEDEEAMRKFREENNIGQPKKKP